MHRVARPLAFVVLASLALFATGCSSNNKGKIVGKWKLTSGAGLPPEAQEIASAIYIEFKADGKVAAGVDVAGLNPMQKAMMQGAPTAQDFATYSLLSGDGVDIKILPEIKEQMKGGTPIRDGKVKITIDGDNMTMTDAKDTIKLTRMK